MISLDPRLPWSFATFLLFDDFETFVVRLLHTSQHEKWFPLFDEMFVDLNSLLCWYFYHFFLLCSRKYVLDSLTLNDKVCGRDSSMIKRYEQFYFVEFTIPQNKKRFVCVQLSWYFRVVKLMMFLDIFFWYFLFLFYLMRQEFLRYQKRLLLKVTSSWNFIANCRIGQTREKTSAILLVGTVFKLRRHFKLLAGRIA